MFLIDPGPEEVVHDFMTGSAIWDDSGLELVTWIFTEQAQSTARVWGSVFTVILIPSVPSSCLADPRGLSLQPEHVYVASVKSFAREPPQDQTTKGHGEEERSLPGNSASGWPGTRLREGRRAVGFSNHPHPHPEPCPALSPPF